MHCNIEVPRPQHTIKVKSMTPKHLLCYTLNWHGYRDLSAFQTETNDVSPTDEKHGCAAFASDQTTDGITDRISGLLYHCRTLWLFTASDIKSILIPTIAFGILSALSGPVLHLNHIGILLLIRRTLTVFGWGWMNLLNLCLNNQRRPEAVVEDQRNKPWRPLPSKRITIQNTEYVFWVALPLNCIFSLYTGGFHQSLLLTFLNFWYNDGDGGENLFFRNLINACGFMLYSSAAMEIIAQSSSAWKSPTAIGWILVIGGIVFTTIHIQDLRDQEGDRDRGRRTLPLIIGDGLSRITIAIPIAVWSLFCPLFWHLPLIGYVLPLALGLLLIVRLARVRTSKGDSLTFKIWSVWLISMYSLPLLKRTFLYLFTNN